MWAWYENLSGWQVLAFWVVTIALAVWIVQAVIGQGKFSDLE